MLFSWLLAVVIQLVVVIQNSDKSGARKVSQRNVGIQKEVAMRSPEARRGSPIMVDSSQQTGTLIVLNWYACSNARYACSNATFEFEVKL